MHRQLELIMQSIRTSTGQNGPVSAPSSPIKHSYGNGENSKNVHRNSTFNLETKSADELHAQKKHKLTSDEMRRFYARERHPSNVRHDSFGSNGSAESPTIATIKDSTYQTNSCNSSPKTLSRESTVDSVRSDSARSSISSWFKSVIDTVTPSLSSQISIDESDVFIGNIGKDCKDYCVRLVFCLLLKLILVNLSLIKGSQSKYICVVTQRKGKNFV